MTKKRHGALIFSASDFANGIDGLKKIIDGISGFLTIVSISSIYKRYHERSIENFNSDLIFSARVETDLSHQDLITQLKTVSPGILLLAYDQEVYLFPGKNLPHQDLHSDSLTLRCAAEAWGTYEHPVLGQTLNEIVRSDHGLEKVEFFAQGRAAIESS